ncbi:MAG: MCE family protein [Actinomycetota bacterium]|nr:MCE family protein [Actinomycetota bacterium]
MELTPRRRNMLTGAIALILLISAVSVGVKAAFGAFDGGYQIVGTFDAAGQGLLAGSDVKINGVNVGEVRRIDLVDRKARITLTIDDGESVPADAVARIRAKTLFGEKFVDLDVSESDEADGPFLAAGDELAETEGGFELEALLTDLHPILSAIDPDELFTVLHTLAEGADGVGENLNRALVNGAVLGEVFADNADLTAQFLEDFALLSEELGGRADDLLELAEAANVALPTLNEGEDQVVELLQQTGRLSSDVADLLEAHQPFVDGALGGGTETIQVLYDHRDSVVPLVVGLRQYFETLSSAIRIDVGNGTLMAAVKGVLGGDLCGLVPCQSGPGNPDAGVDVPAVAPTLPQLPGILDAIIPPAGDDPGLDLFRLLGRVLGG